MINSKNVQLVSIFLALSGFNGSSAFAGGILSISLPNMDSSAVYVMAQSSQESNDSANTAKDSNESKPAETVLEGAVEKAEKQGKPPHTGTYTDEAVKHYNRAVELHQSGFLNQAVDEYKAAIEADDRIEEAYSNLGVIYTAQRNYPRAKEAFIKALSLKPSRPTTLNGLGTVYYSQGHIEEAKEKWRQAIVNDPNFSAAYFNLGNAYEREKKQSEARQSYMKAIATTPNMADAYFKLGTIMVKEKHLPQAFILLKRAISIEPDAEFSRDAKRIISELDAELTNSSSHKENAKMEAPHAIKSVSAKKTK